MLDCERGYGKADSLLPFWVANVWRVNRKPSVLGTSSGCRPPNVVCCILRYLHASCQSLLSFLWSTSRCQILTVKHEPTDLKRESRVKVERIQWCRRADRERIRIRIHDGVEVVVIYFESGRTDSASPESLLELMNETNDWNEGQKSVWRLVSRFQ